MDVNGYKYYKGSRDPYPPEMFDPRHMNGRGPKMIPPDKDGKKRRSEKSEDDDTASLDSTGHRKSFTRLITRFAEKTSMQGVPYINSAKLIWAKVIWSVLLLGALAMVAVHLWYLCDQFFQFPRVTKLTLGFDNLRFPKVTLCNTNQLHRGRFDKFNGAAALKELIDDLKPENLVPDQFDADYDPTNTQPPPPEDTNGGTGTGTGSGSGTGTGTGTGGQNQGSNPTGRPPKRRKRFIEQTKGLNVTEYDPEFADQDDDRDFNNDEFAAPVDQTTKIEEAFKSLFMDINARDRRRLGHNISDMLLGCTFSGRTCDASMFRLVQTAEYGNCWSIDINNFRSTSSGPSGGLSLILYLEVTEYLEGINNGYGIRLAVQQPNTFPFPADEGHSVSASFETNVGLKMISIEREDHPYGDCDPNIAHEFEAQYNFSYTARACYMKCEIDAMISTCGCFADNTEALAILRSGNDTSKRCRSNKERKCKNLVAMKIDRKEISCHCPVPCKEVAYERYFSSRQWPSDSYAMVLLQAVCEKDPYVCKTIRNNLGDSRTVNYNFLKLNIYYEDLNFENITEAPEIENAQFASDVGGAIGLWIGLSILSICEVLQLLVELCDYAFHKTVRENAQKRKQKQRKRTRRHSDGDIRHNRQDVNGREPDSEQQWPHTQYNGHNKDYLSKQDGHHPQPQWDPSYDRHHKHLYGNNSHTYSNPVLP